jgi:hypothetical protein
MVTQFADFTVWPLEAAQIPVPLATPTVPAAPAATPVAGADSAGQDVALRLDEHDESGIDALAVLSDDASQTTIAIAARDASGGEVVVVHDGTCDEASTLPTFLLQDLDDSGRSETTIEAPLSDLTSGAHSIAIHRSSDDYDDVVACGDIPRSE